MCCKGPAVRTALKAALAHACTLCAFAENGLPVLPLLHHLHQCQNMFDSGRWIATVVYLGAIAATLAVAFTVRRTPAAWGATPQQQQQQQQQQHQKSWRHTPLMAAAAATDTLQVPMPLPHTGHAMHPAAA
jgi:hypothetical protein